MARPNCPMVIVVYVFVCGCERECAHDRHMLRQTRQAATLLIAYVEVLATNNGLCITLVC